jgi:hypothetical protein
MRQVNALNMPSERHKLARKRQKLNRVCRMNQKKKNSLPLAVMFCRFNAAITAKLFLIDV